MYEHERTKLWRRDPQVERCGAIVTSSHTGRQCKYDAMEGSDPPRCPTHLHREEEKGRGRFLPRFYLKSFRPTLAKKIEELVDAMPAVEQLDVTDELQLIRVAAADSVKMYADACELPEGSKGDEARVLAGELMFAKMKDVISACDTAARVQEVKLRVQGAFVDVMAQVITAVMHAVHDVLGDDHQAVEIERRLRENFEARKLPGAEGTLLTPDRDVIEMDSTVPAEATE